MLVASSFDARFMRKPFGHLDDPGRSWGGARRLSERIS
jgi:hypothetical protein